MKKKVIFAKQPKEHGKTNNTKAIHITANVFQKIMHSKPHAHEWVTEATLLGQNVNKVNINVSRLSE